MKRTLVAAIERTFLDSNILVYSAIEDPRAEIAVRCLASPFEISVQILNEYVNVAFRKLGFNWDEITFSLERFTFAAREIHGITIDRQREGVRIARRYQLGIHDATIVATALTSGCTLLLSEDMHDGLVIDGRLTIRNPFA